jgi:hypothetical protein
MVSKKRVNKKQDKKAAETIPTKLRLMDGDIQVESADYWVVSNTPEEVVIRFTNSDRIRGDQVEISHRIVMSFYAAKRLQTVLQETVKKYEGALTSIRVGSSSTR